MSQAVDRDELTLMLARAFDEAWAQYYLPSRSGALPEGLARRWLAMHLVSLAKRGTKREDALAAAGLRHLISLTPSLEQTETLPAEDIAQQESSSEVEAEAQQSLQSRLDSAPAAFVPGWRIPSRRLF
jgi:hypothetical protein